MGGFDYPNEFTYEAEGLGAGIAGFFVIIYLLVWLFSMAFCVATYVLHSIGLYTIAKRRGIHHPWLAWVPVGSLWLLGSVSDQYQYVVKGKIKNKRRVMLGLSIAMVAVYVIWIFSMIMSIILSEGIGSGAAMAVLLAIVGMLGFMAIAIWLTVFQYMAYYDLYRSCDPDNGVLFLVFSILFSVTMPFFVFACRKKDLGMPPRKQPAQPVAIPTVETVVDPNVVEKVVIPTVETVVDPNVVEKVVVPTVEPIVESTTEPVAEGFAQPEEFEEE